MKKIILLVLIFINIINFSQVQAQENNNQDNIFQARVIEILEEQEVEIENNKKVLKQKIKLLGLENEFKNKEIIFDGLVENFTIIKKNIYKVRDKVLVLETFNDQQEASYYIIDYIRTDNLYFLLGLFIFILILVAGFKGLRSLASLIISFLIIIKFIIPQILAGSNPLLITFIGSILILIVIIYLTEGFNLVAHLSIFSIFLSLLITIFLSWLFVNLTYLSGLSNEESFYLINLGDKMINFKGLLLAGIIIGALGVLDDVVLSQISIVKQITQDNPHENKKEIFKKSYKIGLVHIGSMVNTLFLAYAGASLSMLLLFFSGQSAFSSWQEIINNENITTEIVRSLTGSIGLILAVPIATLVGVLFLKK